MEKPDAITVSTITLAISVVGGWIWATTFFMVRADADDMHEKFKKDIRKAYLELKIDQHTTEMVFIEQAGIANEELRDYDLLKFSVERMTGQLMELQ
jgi:hypothetical protein